jgi:hypothetical protein
MMTLLRSYLVCWSNATDFIKELLLYIILHVFALFAPKMTAELQQSCFLCNATLNYAICVRLFMHFSSLHSNSRTLHQVSPRQFPFTLFRIQSSPIVISFYALYSEVVTEKNVNLMTKNVYFNLRNKVFNSSSTFLQKYATFKIG